jgi:predicted dehydrogenase
VTAETTFSGFDAYQKVIAAGADLVILATPPGFRPMHLEAAINAGKHVFMEKPVAVDSAGVRSVMASGASAKSKNLAIVAGTQRRHQLSYVETIKRIHDGAIGQVLGGQVYWNQGGLWLHQRKPEWSDTEYQIRNWIYYTWVGGDHIVEQHVHNIDVANWVMGAHPISAYGMGGRQSRTDAAYGHVFDHFAIEFEYPGGVKVSSFCRQIDGTAPRVGEEFHGTKGTTNAQNSIRAAERWRYEGKNPNPYVQEHVDLIASIRAGKPLNEAQQIAESTLSAIMGRLTAYTGQMVTWEQALNADLNLMPPTLELGAMPIAPIAIPGRTPMPAQKA